MAKTENEEHSVATATQEKTIATTPVVGTGIGTRFRIATTASADYYPIFDQQLAQLTVSSVNTILEDLTETDDEDDEKPRRPSVKTDKLVDVGPPQSLRQIVAGAPVPLVPSGGKIPTCQERRTRHPSDPKGQRPLLRRERSPVVSFDEKPPATVIIENVKYPALRPRSRSDATRFIKFRSPSSSFSSSSGTSGTYGTGGTAAKGSPPTPPIDGSGGGGAGGGKMAWLRERRRSVQKIAFGTSYGTGGTAAASSSADREIPSEEAACGRDELVAALESSMADQKAAATRRKLLKGRLKSPLDVFDVRPTKTMRPRTKSDKFDRMATKVSKVEVSRAAAFDWPLGRLGKLRQKYSRSSVALTEGSGSSACTVPVPPPPPPHSNLKRHNSEKNKRRNTMSGGVVRARSVAFEEPSFAQSLWKSSVKFILDKTSGGNRKRHYTDPCKASMRFGFHSLQKTKRDLTGLPNILNLKLVSLRSGHHCTRISCQPLVVP